MAKAKKPRQAKPKQGTLKGEGFPQEYPEIEAAAESYVEARNERMANLETEVARQEELMVLMVEHKLKNYEYDGRIISLTELQKVSVKRKKADKED